MFINEVALEIIRNGKHGSALPGDFGELFILLFADDIILLSETPVGLQNQLNNLYKAASNLKLRVNMTKSNIIVFRKGGYLASRERWVYGDIEMKVVNSYKYLGIYFSTKLSFCTACIDLAGRAKKTLVNILAALRRLENSSPSVYFKLFDGQVQPILQYGAEIWAFGKAAYEVEKVHTYGMKKFLGVDRRTPNDFLYGELDRYPVYLNSYVRCIRFWLKLTRMEEHRVPYKAYKMLQYWDQRGKLTWATQIRTMLNKYGFSLVWENQGVESIAAFIRIFRQRIIDCRWQEWENHIQTSERFQPYSLFKHNHLMEAYLKVNMNVYVRKSLTKFRFGVSGISVHSLRFRRIDVCELVCPLCKTDKEDEIHFMFLCPAYDDLRGEYIPQKYYRSPCLFRLCILMSSSNETTMRNLSLYVHKALNRRTLAVE